MIKRLTLLGLILFSIFRLVFPSTVAAQQPIPQWAHPDFKTFMDKVRNAPENEIFGERYTLAQVFWIFNSLVFLIGGDDATCVLEDGITQIEACLRQPSSTTPAPGSGAPASYRPGSLMTIAGISDAMLRTQPASGIDYVATKLQKFDLIPTAHAQEGYGFRALQPAQALWVVTRNASYALFTLVILVMAFLIMFRVKISPQVTISVQSALPKVVMALILITFSYAIAGLLVDLMYVMQGLVAVMVTTTQTGVTSVVNTSAVNPVQMLYNLQQTTSAIMSYALITLFQAFGGGGFYAAVFGSSAVAVVADLVIGIVLIVVFLIAAIRLLWTLLRAYVTVLLLVIAGPFMILWATISPSGSVFGWVKQIFANLTVFPVTGILIFLAHVLYWTNADYSNAFIGAGGAGCGGTAAGGTLVNQLNPYRICGIGDPANAIGGLPSFSLPMPMVGFLAGLALMISIPSLAGVLKNTILNLRADYGRDLEGAAGFVGAPFVGGYRGITGAAQKAFGGWAYGAGMGAVQSRLGDTRLGRRIFSQQTQTSTAAARAKAGGDAPPHG